MPKIMWKSLHLCFPSNLTKCYTSPCLPPPSSSAAAEDLDHPNRPSIVLINNFNFLYNEDHRDLDLPSSSTTTTTTSYTATSSNESDTHDISPDLSAAFASRRFFFSSPGRSNAITDSPETRSSDLSCNYDNATIKKTKKHHHPNNYDTSTTRILTGGTAVKLHVYSPDPLADFRRSMEEMIHAAIIAGEFGRTEDEGYDFLNELLRSYLSLNPTDTHKFVIRAFSDVMVSLLSE
ncbi:unnamed protein product [Cochlearia groenlandica]